MKTILLSLVASLALSLAAGCKQDRDQPMTPGQRGPAPEEAPPPAAEPAEQPASGQASPEPLAQPATDDAAAQAKQIFTTRCVICHGADGKGDGPTAASLNPKPRDYTDEEWQKSVTDEDLAKIIVGGGPSVGKSPLMPANPDLQEKPEVVSELVKLIRAFGEQG